MADHKLYRPPTQSQNSNMWSVSMPNSATAVLLVDTATKCLAMSCSLASRRNHWRAVLALVMVSCVVKVLEAMMNNVVSGWTFSSTSRSCEPSTLETKCMRRRGWPKFFSAVHIINGPKSEPPMPIFTTSVITWWLYPSHSPLRTAWAKCPILRNTAFTLGITSSPSTMMGVLARLRRATCRAARCSVVLILSPWNICCMRSGRPASRASCTRLSITLSVMRFLE